jgi:hypothetical protein
MNSFSLTVRMASRIARDRSWRWQRRSCQATRNAAGERCRCCAALPKHGGHGARVHAGLLLCGCDARGAELLRVSKPSAVWSGGGHGGWQRARARAPQPLLALGANVAFARGVRQLALG